MRVGEGVLASGESGMWAPEDFRLELAVLVFRCSLCLSPSVEGLVEEEGDVDDTEDEELSPDPEHSPADTPDSDNGSFSDWRLELALSMPAISAEARLLDSFRNKLLVFLRLSASRFLCCLSLEEVTVLRAILMLLGSRLLPPVLMLVVSRGVARMVTASPPLTSSCSTWVCTSPATPSPLMWVMRSPALSPASWAGDPFSTSMTK